MSRDFDADIVAAEERLGATIAQMEQVRQQFVSATTELIQPWYWEQTEAFVRREAERTKSLGVEKLSQLKAEVRGLQESAPTTANELLSDDSLWWHREQGDQSYFYFGNRAPDVLDKAVRLIAGRLAPILEKYGYLPTNPHEHGVWREWDKTGNHHPPGARPYYTAGLAWSEQMKTLVKTYEGLQKEAHRMVSEAEGIKKAKQSAEAKDLWDRA